MHLTCHPDTPCEAIARIDVDVSRSRSGILQLQYTATGRIAGVRWPALASPSRTDELWRHTCFEAFLRPGASETYYEFNLAPSTQWAAYRFDAYRAGMVTVSEVTDPRVVVQSGPSQFILQTTIDLAHLPQAAPWHLGLSAVIEETGGRISYWALCHPPGKPDFHHADCFARQIAAASDT
jgi:hypothetical protein